jgi:hypothetical protein
VRREGERGNESEGVGDAHSDAMALHQYYMEKSCSSLLLTS